MDSLSLESLSLELLQEIFKLACLDDGTTGRSLSQVSHWIRTASERYRYQSLVLREREQIAPFLEIFKSAAPAKKPVVRHLCVSFGMEDEARDARAYVQSFSGSWVFRTRQWIDHEEDAELLRELVSLVAPTLVSASSPVDI
ncbi:hypothetical protein PUNSTDRAFT_132430 [Punctularia strigosozonata HHB-11173 SS5]|uniref:uncharacterized protein n=1 Tax=Punctularia strigosozonata (strain HHB-11173) TaxID=741275 RepID=UPI0004417BB2|nr:uncharacterized protein PUNSTDRAFT_132430 [Punctularia strigosozonata HHB-11173 SS5]EIN10336.1 hypothetical protein PUNSTDRAFT_132430 [Punctularia strigosozonata HHB-11173 SS5]